LWLQSGLSMIDVIAVSFSGDSPNTIAPESGDRSRTSNVSIDSLLDGCPWHFNPHRASTDLERDFSALAA